MKLNLRQSWKTSAWMTMALWCAGCQVSGGNPEGAVVQSAVQENTEIPEKTIDVGAVLNTHTSALTLLQHQKTPGIARTFNSELDRASSLEEAWFKAISVHSEGTQMLLALRMAESDLELIPEAIRRIEKIKSNARTAQLDDIFDYHIGRLYAFLAETQDGDEAKVSRQRAFDAFSRVMAFRKSPYYHLAYAGKIKQGIQLELDITRELRLFILTYPDYPGLNAFKIALASRDYGTDQSSKAVQSMLDLAFYYPWSPSAKDAQAWIDARAIEVPERTFEEKFSRVESLRKARFWDDAKAAAVSMMAEYPESYQLMVQHARIAYERSYHEEAAKRFETILEKLDGETKDKLRPAGVIAYLYRAYGYMGNCSKALEYHAINAARLGKKDRARETMEFALTCGALDVAYENAKIVYADSSDATELWKFGFIAYLAGDYESARMRFAMAQDGLSGMEKRRLNYFIAQATLKSALKQASGDTGQLSDITQVDDKTADSLAKSDAQKSKKGSTKSKKSTSKSTKKKTITLQPATVERAMAQFQAIIRSDSGDYYALLAHSRLAEIERGADAPMVESPVIQTFGEVIQKPEPNRPWSHEFSYDEKKSLSSFRAKVESLKSAVPEFERVLFLHDAELYLERNALFRTLAIEIMGISKLSKRPTVGNLWSTKLSVDGHLVDNRRKKTGFWGCELETYHFELPGKKELQERCVIAERQGAIYDRASELKPFVRETLAAFHDYYLARRYTPAIKGICGDARTIDDCSTLYPHAFSSAVIRAARENGITPDLIWALMNIESAFNHDSISHADAYGLLQIIPMTGYKIADAKHVDGFGPYDLIRPEWSISMGAWYFSQILRKFHGNAALSMASYNGGPHQVARWLTAYAGKMEQDAFVELIPLNEARNYVKKGMARLLVFHRIDHQDSGYFFEIPNTLPESFEVMPNY